MVITGDYPELVIPKVSLYRYAADMIKQHNNDVAIVSFQYLITLLVIDCALC